MAKDKERTLNPAAAQRKLEKQKALKKGKAQVAAQRTERLAHRNPHRLQTQISDLQALKESSGGKLSARDQRQLEELEKDVTRVQKARESLGEQAPQFGQQGGRVGGDGRGTGRDRGRGGGNNRASYGGLGKRSRDGAGAEAEASDSEETDEDVRRIPWPKDTPPPVPRPDRRQHQHQHQRGGKHSSEATSANREPLGAERFPNRGNTVTNEEQLADYVPDTSLPVKPATAATTAAAAAAVVKTYESKPQVRDLRKEATAKFIPSAVKRKIDATKGVGGRLLEEEEVRKLEGEGYGVPEANKGGAANVEEDVGDAEEEGRRLREEEEAFQRALGAEPGEGAVEDDEDDEDDGQDDDKRKRVEVEDVSDEDL